MKCESPGCDKFWNIELGVAGLPACHSNCWLLNWAQYMGGDRPSLSRDRLEVSESTFGAYSSSRSNFNYPLGGHLQSCSYKSDASTSIAEIHHDIGNIQPYVLGGKGVKKQNACTKVKWSGGEKSLTTGKTTAQMHSEMEAVKFMLDNGHWVIINGEIFTSSYNQVGADEFSTEEMHCGWCTLFLQILNLPLCRPSDGNFNLACNLGYPLPEQIKNSPHVMYKFIFYKSDDDILSGRMIRMKLLFDKILKIPSNSWFLQDFNGLYIGTIGTSAKYFLDSELPERAPKLTWEFLFDYDGGAVRDVLWNFIFKVIYENLK